MTNKTASGLNHKTNFTRMIKFSAIKTTKNILLRGVLLLILLLHLPSSSVIVDATDDVGSSICQVCGEGLQVGSPDTIFDFPGQPSISCGELEVAGEQGLVDPISCGYLQIVISDVCDCQVVVSPSAGVLLQVSSPTMVPPPEGFCNVCGGPGLTIANPNNHLFLGTSLVECRFVARQGELGAIDAMTCATLPQAMSDYCGGCSTTAPALTPTTTTGNNGMGAPSDLQNDLSTFDDSDAGADGFSVFVVMFTLFLGGILLCMVCMAFWFRSSNRLLQTERQTMAATVDLEQQQQDTSVLPVAEDRAVRKMVLASIFPEQTVSSDDAHDLLWYDPKVRQYRRWADQKEGTEKTCSICLEELEAQNRVVSGLCSHIYHRECILEWLNNKKRHDDCPNCRQPMWKPETYQAIKEDILQTKNARELKAAQTVTKEDA